MQRFIVNTPSVKTQKQGAHPSRSERKHQGPHEGQDKRKRRHKSKDHSPHKRFNAQPVEKRIRKEEDIFAVPNLPAQKHSPVEISAETPSAAPITTDSSTTTTASFSEMNISPLLKKAIHELKYQTPTPIQAKTIPLALDGKDILGCAQTGTGKTAAFLIPIINQMLTNLQSTAVVLVPTRELANQIQDVLKGLTAQTKHISHAVLIGGMSMQPQLRALQKKPRFIIATPGRMIDHLNRRSVQLNRCAFLVLDEADRMLDMGFIPQLKEIFKTLPKERQTLLFTATLPANIVQISKQYMRHPTTISVGTTSAPAKNITQSVIETTQKEKQDKLIDVLNEKQGTAMIFVRTKRRADKLHQHLVSYGFETGIIHGGKSQGQRTRALDEFRDGETRILVATDVASRGIDVPHVSLVVNYDLPEIEEDYVHRIGRTARAGKTGEAVALLVPEEKRLWADIQKLIRK